MGHVVFRVDSSVEMGSGHLMRCLTLADRLKQDCHEILFICRCLDGARPQLITDRGFDVQLLPEVSVEVTLEFNEMTPHASWLHSSPVVDAGQTLAVLEEAGIYPDWLVVDHYSLNETWEGVLRARARKILAIDDLADRKHDCDILLDQNFFLNQTERYFGLIPSGCLQLLGPDYAILKDQFKDCLRKDDARLKENMRILVFLGGADPTNESLKVLEGIKMLNRSLVEVDLVIGSMNPWRVQLESFAKRMGNVRCLINVNNMAELMNAADLGIGAVGTTTWERCFIGLPSLVVSIADNQRILALELEKLGAHLYLGDAQWVSVEKIHDALSELLKNPKKLSEMHFKSKRIVDGRGVSRVVEAMGRKS